MNIIWKKLADHAVAATIVGSLLLILLGIGLIFNPALVAEILRYLFGVVNITLGAYLLVNTVSRMRKK